jgi:putative membrane protein
MGVLWLKVLHVLAVICWMAALLYLPRLFVNHAGRDPGSEAAQMLLGMERRLINAIMRPAALIAILTGGGLIAAGLVDWSLGWMWVKLGGVVALIVMHGLSEGWYRQFAAGRSTHSHRFFRVANEVPTLAMIVIVAMVVAKPF